MRYRPLLFLAAARGTLVHNFTTAAAAQWADFRNPGPSNQTRPFTHNFSNAGAALWSDFGYSLLTDSQAGWIAENYAVVSLEKCTGRVSGMRTESAILKTAAQLKAKRKALRVMFYWSVSQAGIDCYSANATFAAHPEWWLKDDNGTLVTPRRIDVMCPAAVQWWLSVVPVSSALIDGVLADDAGYNAIANISAARLDALYDAKLQMLSELQRRFDTAGRGGVVFGNGLSQYDQSPSDPHNRRIVSVVGGVQNEHFCAFEQVDASTGRLHKEKAADALDEIEWASRNETKNVFASFWAGPYIGFAPASEGVASGWPRYFNDTQPCGRAYGVANCTRADLYAGWRAALQKWLPFNLAAFLTVASRTTFFTQAVWYELHQGFVPCREAPDTCAFPDQGYPLLHRKLGAPLAPREKLGRYRWRRRFEHATVSLDLSDPLGKSGVVFHQEEGEGVE
jgi:hypothetical protein